jgi:diaminopimelate epimerase
VIRLTKHHGLGNDFLVALAVDNPGLAPDPAVARALCDRHQGIGADGLLHALPSAPDSDADATMALLNADGSAAEISGNGIRCLAQAILRREGRPEGDVVLDTAAGRRTTRTVRGDVEGELWVEVDLGAHRPGPALGAAEGHLPGPRAATVDMGNPHLVCLVEDPVAVDLATLGPRLEGCFADGINVEVIAPRADGGLDLRVWERGAGLTQACGSGAAAAVVAAHTWGAVGERVEVHMPGGNATVEVGGGTVLLTGPTVFVAEVVVP